MDEERSSADRTLEQAMDLWFRPELLRRKWPESELRAGQVVLAKDDAPRVLLNGEVELIAGVELHEVRPHQEQDRTVLVSAIRRVTHVMPASVPQDCGHFTIYRHANTWHCSFDFRLGRDSATAKLERAREFLETAEACLAAGRIHAASDTLFSAAELVATAFVLSSPFAETSARKLNSHAAVNQKFNFIARRMNLCEVKRSAFNHLRALRHDARYSTQALDAAAVTVYVAPIRDLIDEVRERIAPLRPPEVTP